MRWTCVAIVAMACVLGLGGEPARLRGEPAPAAESTATVIQAEEAADHIGEECVVEMVVQAAKKLPDKDICFLNSRKDHRDEENFTAVIFKAGLERFRAGGIEDPALHYIDKTIRVRGAIEEHDGRPQIKVDEPGQIEIVPEDD